MFYKIVWKKESSNLSSVKIQNLFHFIFHSEKLLKGIEKRENLVIFDAASHELNSISLKSCLNAGPNLYDYIFCILSRLRFQSVTFITDVKQAFLQIVVDKKVTDIFSFLFSDNRFEDSSPHQVLDLYEFYSGWTVAETIKHHFKKLNVTYPGTVCFLNENI